MKTCKKTLSLVLVFALVMSVFAYSASADFTDQDEITYEEAAVVLEALGVIDGYEDGSYQPDVVLSREEAAAIIARMKLGGSADNLTAGSAPFSDVSADRWSAGYIAYCVSEGVVDGFEDGTFRPEDELTCYQFAKMLLVALGYDADSEGLTGTSWATNTVSYAVNAGIFDDVASYSGSADRDTVAQMAFNTLLADLVEYPSGNIIIDSGDTSIVINGSGASRIENTSDTDYNIDYDGYYQFAERYFSDLELVEVGIGDYGRPVSYNWELDGDVIYAGTGSDSLLETYDSWVTRGTLYSLIGSSAYSDITDSDTTEGNLYIYVDGEPLGSSTGLVPATYVTNYIQRNSSGYPAYEYNGSSYYLCGYGVQTEVYLTDGGDVYIIVINTYAGVVQEDYDEDNGGVELVVYGYDNLTGTANYEEEYEIDDEDFDISGYVEGDYVLVTFNGEENIASVEPASSVSGTITGYTSGSSITVDGTTYYFADAIDSSTFATGSFSVDTEIGLVLDEYGYVVATTDAASSSNYVYVYEIASPSGLTSTSYYEAAVFFADGTYDEVVINSIDGSSVEEEDAGVAGSDDEGATGWYSYTVNSSGRYRLTSLASADNTDDNPDVFTVNGKTRIVNGSSRFAINTTDGSTRSNLTATSSTVFIVYDGGDYDVYTGYNNVPDITPESGGSLTVSAVRNTNNYAIAVMIIVEGNADISGGGGTSSDYVFIRRIDNMSTSMDSSGTVYYTYSAFVNGEATTIDAIDDDYTVGLYTDISYDSDGYIDEMDSVSAEQTISASTKLAISASSDVIVVGTGSSSEVYELASDYSIYLIDGTSYSSVSSAVRLESRLDGETLTNQCSIYAELDDDGLVTTLYLVSAGISDL